MHTADIQAALKKKGLSQRQVATDLGVSPITVSNIVRKDRVSAKIMRYIAELINKDPREVFPEYFLKPPKRSHSKVNA